MGLVNITLFCVSTLKVEYGLRLASHIFVKDISPESLAARDGNIQEGDVVLKVREKRRRFEFVSLWVSSGCLKLVTKINGELTDKT